MNRPLLGLLFCALCIFNAGCANVDTIRALKLTGIDSPIDFPHLKSFELTSGARVALVVDLRALDAKDLGVNQQFAPRQQEARRRIERLEAVSDVDISEIQTALTSTISGGLSQNGLTTVMYTPALAAAQGLKIGASPIQPESPANRVDLVIWFCAAVARSTSIDATMSMVDVEEYIFREPILYLALGTRPDSFTEQPCSGAARVYRPGHRFQMLLLRKRSLIGAQFDVGGDQPSTSAGTTQRVVQLKGVGVLTPRQFGNQLGEEVLFRLGSR